MIVQRRIMSIRPCQLQSALALVEQVFTVSENEAEGRMVRALVEEIRSKAYYLPQLELVMTDETDQLLGYAMFSRFHLEGRYENELLLLSPVAVRTDVQRQHISRELIEHGFGLARKMGFKAVIVEGNPRNYNPRGFVTAALHGITPSEKLHLPAIECLMVKELVPGALEGIRGKVDYSFYDTLA